MSGADLQKEVDAFAKFFGRPPIDLEILADVPITILVSQRERENSRDVGWGLEFIVGKLLPSHNGPQSVLYRGVDLPQLGQILCCGCDVTPTTAPLFAADSAQKALEYGAVVMAFDAAKLKNTSKRVLKSESPEALSQLRAVYPVEEEIDEKWIRFSRPQYGDGRFRATGYGHYDFFIPGNPREALLMVFLVGSDRQVLRAEFLRCAERTNQVCAPS